MNIITKNGKIDYKTMLTDITRQGQRWQKTMPSLKQSSELLIIAQQHLRSLERMKHICEKELNTH